MHFSHVNPRLIGGLLWASSVQYFIVQLIVISAWTVPHSFANNFISDLGNTECGMYAGLPVCSPLWPLMNLSFVVFGSTMALGALLLRKHFKITRVSAVAFGLMVLSGIGTIMVGMFPENTINSLHMIGAFFGLGVGNLSVLLLGVSLSQLPKWLRAYTVLLGLLSLTAFALFVAGIHLGIGRGGMERLISYPFTVWMTLFGLYVAGLQQRKRPFQALNS